MKKLILFSLAAITLLWMGCGPQADVNSILKNAESKDKIFTAILEDHELMTEFMTKMMSNEHAMMMMMKGNHDMMGKMMDGGNMMQMMNQEGMMSNECMQSCTKMMADKGMKMDMGMMGDKGSSTEKEGGDHDAHH